MKTITTILFVACFSVSFTASAQEHAFMPDDAKASPTAAAVSTEDVLFFNSRAYTSDEKPAKQYGFGVEVHTNYVPSWFLNIAMRGSHDVTGNGFGAKVMVRSKNVDIAIKGMYWKIDAPDGIYLGINHDWVDAEYTEFKDFGLAYLELTATWNSSLTENLYLTYGFGIGGGVVLGDIYTRPAYGCTADNFENPNTIGTGCYYMTTAIREKEDLPPGMGVLEVFGGVRYDVTKNITVKGELGIFLPGMLRATMGLEFLF